MLTSTRGRKGRWDWEPQLGAPVSLRADHSTRSAASHSSLGGTLKTKMLVLGRVRIPGE